jgi:NodT family efflux transporter outer membrane factor (OMF) lipoprotein
VVSLSGCAGFQDYVHKGFKVGPNYCPPTASTSEHWIDASDARVREDQEVATQWWTVFNDSTLNRLVACAYEQNLSLKEACFRILQARAELGIVTGNILPQVQNAAGSYTRRAASLNPPTHGDVQGDRYSSQWNFGFNLAWELDFWGRFRRAIEAAEDTLEASVADYDDVLVTLEGDIATNYVQVRTLQERIKLLKANVELQRGVLQFIEKRIRAGFKVTELDLAQARSTLAQTEAAIPQLEIELRQAANRLCVLLGTVPTELQAQLGEASIPTAPPEAAVGIPANLVGRRPDIRRAQLLAAAQAEQIGISEAEWYPIFTINGTMGWQARQFSSLFSQKAFSGSIGPSFQWNILNYGRIANDVRFQDARFRELAVAYQNTVLLALEEVENGLVTFLRTQERSKLLDESVTNSKKAVHVVVVQYEVGTADFNRYAVIEQNLVVQQDSAAQARGQIAQGLIQVYRALGGGWRIRYADATEPPPAAAPAPAEASPSKEQPASSPKSSPKSSPAEKPAADANPPAAEAPGAEELPAPLPEDGWSPKKSPVTPPEP